MSQGINENQQNSTLNQTEIILTKIEALQNFLKQKDWDEAFSHLHILIKDFQEPATQELFQQANFVAMQYEIEKGYYKKEYRIAIERCKKQLAGPCYEKALYELENAKEIYNMIFKMGINTEKEREEIEELKEKIRRGQHKLKKLEAQQRKALKKKQENNEAKNNEVMENSIRKEQEIEMENILLDKIKISSPIQNITEDHEYTFIKRDFLREEEKQILKKIDINEETKLNEDSILREFESLVQNKPTRDLNLETIDFSNKQEKREIRNKMKPNKKLECKEHYEKCEKNICNENEEENEDEGKEFNEFKIADYQEKIGHNHQIDEYSGEWNEKIYDSMKKSVSATFIEKGFHCSDKFSQLETTDQNQEYYDELYVKNIVFGKTSKILSIIMVKYVPLEGVFKNNHKMEYISKNRDLQEEQLQKIIKKSFAQPFRWFKELYEKIRELISNNSSRSLVFDENENRRQSSLNFIENILCSNFANYEIKTHPTKISIGGVKTELDINFLTIIRTPMKTPQLFSGIPRFHSYFLAESEIHEFLEFLTGKNQAYMKAKQKQLDQVFFPTKKKFEKNFFYLNIVIGGLIVLTGITNLFSTNFAFFTGILAIILSFYQLMQKYYKEKKKKEEFFEKLNWTPQTIDRLKAKQMGQYIANELYSTHLLQESNQENDNGKDCKSKKSNNKPKDTEQRFKSNKTRRKINLSIEDEKFMKKQKKEIGMHQDLEPRTKILNQNEIKDRFQSSSLIARDQNKKTRRIQSFLED